MTIPLQARTVVRPPAGRRRVRLAMICGLFARITTAKRRLVKGRRRVVSRMTRFRCFKPETIAVSLYVSFAASPAPVAPTS